MASTLLAPATPARPLMATRAIPKRRRSCRAVGGPRLSVVIVNYYQWRETAQLVKQLQAAACVRDGAAEIMIVDNCSPPHPLVGRLRRRPGVSLRRWGRNRGFARAVNEGCRLSRGEWLLLLNPDTAVAPDFLDGVLARADRLAVEEPRTGVVGFQLRNANGSRQPSSGQYPTFLGTFAGLALPRSRRKYRAAPKQRRSRVPWVTGCGCLVRRECLRQLGGLDEDYFLYYEDVDFCRRARAAGWGVWYDPSLRAVHYRPLHARAVPPPIRLCTRHALLTYSAKHWPRWQFRALAGVVRAEAWLRGRLAAWRGDAATAQNFRELGTLVTELVAGRVAAARRRLGRVMTGAVTSSGPSPLRRRSTEYAALRTPCSAANCPV